MSPIHRFVKQIWNYRRLRLPLVVTVWYTVYSEIHARFVAHKMRACQCESMNCDHVVRGDLLFTCSENSTEKRASIERLLCLLRSGHFSNANSRGMSNITNHFSLLDKIR